ncbi:MAG TPA: glycosyltransferase family 39 protein [Terriglobia bacterium]|nr:glycosyltransferase family 39 protein [Terriglobia bacterium]
MTCRLLLILTLALCAFLRFYQLDGYGLWSDEFVTLLIVSSRTFKYLIQTCFEVPQPMPPLYFLADKWIYGFFEPGEIGLRILSAAGSVLAGYFLFAVGRVLFTAEVGLWGLLLFTVNSTQIVYAQNARPYAICLMLSAVSMLCFLQWRRQPSLPWVLGYVISSALLLHAHYIFFPLLLIQNLYLVMVRNRRARAPQNALQWKSWLVMQAGVAALLLPLYPQLWRIIHARHSLNWESKYPLARDFFLFLDPRLLLWGIAAWFLLCIASKAIRNLSGRAPAPGMNPNHELVDRNSLALLGLWYLLPLGLFFVLAYGNGLNLFVERYLILASLPVFLALPAVGLAAGPRWVGRSALLVYFLAYLYTAPVTYFVQKGRFSQGVPGGNEWRETLGRLADPKFQSSLLLFQSPFIESNQLDFVDKPHLARYLSAPLHSFYVKSPPKAFVLLPVHWWIEDPAHQDFKSELNSRVLIHRDFTLLATQEFFDYFEPWLKKQAGTDGEWRVLESFRSPGALRLKRLELSFGR